MQIPTVIMMTAFSFLNGGGLGTMDKFILDDLKDVGIVASVAHLQNKSVVKMVVNCDG